MKTARNAFGFASKFALAIGTAALSFVLSGCGKKERPLTNEEVQIYNLDNCNPSAGQVCPTDPEPPKCNPSAGKECPPKTVAPTACPQKMPAPVTGQPCCLPAWPEALWGIWQLKAGPSPGPEPFECVPAAVVAP